MSKYEEIINLQHFTSKRHPRMSMESRAAQFAPFAALNGYEEALDYSSRIIQSKREVSEEEYEIISRKLSFAYEKKLPVEIEFFCHNLAIDQRAYRKAKGVIHRIDIESFQLVLSDKIIQMNDIVDVKIYVGKK